MGKHFQKTGCLVLIFILFIGLSQVSATSSLEENQWKYKKDHTIIGSTAGELINYQMRFIVHYGSRSDSGEDVYCDSKCRTDFSDIRFANSAGEMLGYWIESKTDGDEAIFWVAIDNIPASPDTTTIWIYFGNSEAQSASNGENTFMFFDDFSRSGVDTSKWTDISQASGRVGIDTSNNWLELTSPASGTSHTAIESIRISTGPIIVDSRRKVVSADWDGTNYVGTAICDNYYIPATGGAFQEDGINGQHSAYPGDGITTVTRSERTLISKVTDNNAYSFPTDTFVKTRLILTSTEATFSIEGHEVSNSLSTDFTTNENKIVLYTNSWSGASATCYEKVDWVFVRHYVDPVPSHGKWGSIEIFEGTLEDLQGSTSTPRSLISEQIWFLLGLIGVIIAVGTGLIALFKTGRLSVRDPMKNGIILIEKQGHFNIESLAKKLEISEEEARRHLNTALSKGKISGAFTKDGNAFITSDELQKQMLSFFEEV